MKRREVENDIESLVRTLNTTLEFIREQDARTATTSASCSTARGTQELPAAPAAPAAPAHVFLPKAETGS